MRATGKCRFALAFTFALGSTSIALAQAPKASESPAPLRDLFIDLDTNNDRVVERDEVPESGQEAFRTLLKYGDANRDGKLEAEEYRNLMLKVNWGQTVPPEQREKRFRNLDKNQDGKLGPQEFQGGSARFGQLDRNGDGFLSRDEIPWLNTDKPATKAKPSSPAKGGDKPALQRLQAMDKDGDGRISRDEFKGRPAMFDRLDANHDGFLDSSERQQRKAESGKKSDETKKE
jgi:Ca2+-binding EF-hand superfamily protein